MRIMAGTEGFSSNINGWFGTTAHLPHHHNQEPNRNPTSPKPNPTTTTTAVAKKKRNLPGTPDPDAEVVALSPKTLMATHRFMCEICNKGFQRDQNLQLHRRGHNLPWKLRQRTNKDQVKKKVYICPEKSCVHHDPGRALGDLTGIKKHFSRKHGEKKWKCEKCSKKYAVQSDWKAHSKTCGTREYKCDCGTLFSRKDSFITHRAFCDALAEESARLTSVVSTNLSFGNSNNNNVDDHTNAITTSSTSSSTTIVNMDHLTHGLGIMSGRTSSHGFQLHQDHFNHHLSKSRLSLWLNQANSSSHNNNLINNNPMDYIYSSSVPEMIQNMGSTTSTSNTTLFGSCSTSVSSLVGLKEEPNRVLNNSSSSSVSSSSSKPIIAPISATALLQKAAQMGSTRSSSNPSFSTTTTTTSTSSPGVVMIMNSSSSSLLSSSATPSNVNVATNMAHHHHHHHGYLDGSNLRSLGNNMSLSSSNNGIENGLTRDFLGSGSGGEVEQRQFLSHNSFGSSAMGLSQFTGNH
ncbi:zinc finger protein BALDIBIS [Humulus lupulus]|uniref:zinc finger protein BALDIBIS n=1 Tax=Humulus lupulus TaxID=3486 RepID=UPI002B4056F4|nr:zinc finger protein BALDIBIS [Humulus lupulus]